MEKLILKLILLALAGLLLSCQSPQQTEIDTKASTPPIANKPKKSNQTECKSPRPEICAQVYQPVCATRDTGVLCVTTPCPSTEQVTKSNACTACSDEKVASYVEGECK